MSEGNVSKFLPYSCLMTLTAEETSNVKTTLGLSSVAFSGSYDDLEDTPDLGTAALKDIEYFATADQGALAEMAVRYDTNSQNLTGTQKQNARTNIGLATVAATGSYNDLSDKVIIDSGLSTTSTNPVQNSTVTLAINSKQNTLVFDSTPTEGSANPVTSTGIKAAINAAQLGVIKLQGSATVSELTGQIKTVGYMYNVTDSGTIVQPSGYSLEDCEVVAGDNVYFSNNGWDNYHGIIDLSSYVEFSDTATASTNGSMSSTDKTKLDGIEENANNYTLPVAAETVLGGVKASADITINSSGVLSLVTITQASSTSTATPAFGGTVAAIDSITIDSHGRITGKDTKTITIPNSVVTTTTDGLMAYTDKIKLDSYPEYSALTTAINEALDGKQAISNTLTSLANLSTTDTGLIKLINGVASLDTGIANISTASEFLTAIADSSIKIINNLADYTVTLTTDTEIWDCITEKTINGPGKITFVGDTTGSAYTSYNIDARIDGASNTGGIYRFNCRVEVTGWFQIHHGSIYWDGGITSTDVSSSSSLYGIINDSGANQFVKYANKGYATIWQSGATEKVFYCGQIGEELHDSSYMLSTLTSSQSFNPFPNYRIILHPSSIGVTYTLVWDPINVDSIASTYGKHFYLEFIMECGEGAYLVYPDADGTSRSIYLGASSVPGVTINGSCEVIQKGSGYVVNLLENNLPYINYGTYLSLSVSDTTEHTLFTDSKLGLTISNDTTSETFTRFKYAFTDASIISAIDMTWGNDTSTYIGYVGQPFTSETTAGPVEGGYIQYASTVNTGKIVILTTLNRITVEYTVLSSNNVYDIQFIEKVETV